jgi:peptidoglycan/xylan/chitin deacetylase (PgdA/CDA1 family)
VDRRDFLGRGAAGAAVAAVVGTTAAAVGVNHERLEGRRAARRANNAGPFRTDDVGSLRMIWSVDVAEPVATLTFDDGPDPEFTPRVLDLLAAAGVTATFNMVGANVGRHPDLAREVVAAGHEVGNHTLTHSCLSDLDPAGTLNEIQGGRDALAAVGVEDVRWFRPPRGVITGIGSRYAAALGHDILMWSVLGGLPGPQTAAEVRDRLARELAPGRIVALHDGIGKGSFDRDAEFARLLAARREAEMEALPEVLARAGGDGIRFVTAGQLVALETGAQPMVTGTS